MKYDHQDMDLARHIGAIFGGNGLSHDQQLQIVAEEICQFRLRYRDAQAEQLAGILSAPVMPHEFTD